MRHLLNYKIISFEAPNKWKVISKVIFLPLRAVAMFADDIPSFFLGSSQFSWGMIESTSTLHLAGCKFDCSSQEIVY